VTTETPRADERPPDARRALKLAIARAVLWVVGVLVLYYVLPLEGPSDLGALFRVLIGGVLVVLVVVWQIFAVVRSSHARSRAIDALSSCVVVIVVAFASTYLNMSARDPEAFNERLERTSALYFTVVTLATIGFGDIVPRTDLARITLMLQVVFNIVILGTAVRLIVDLARRQGPIEPRRRSG
jgi:voltage-gated potassium channel